MPTYQYRCRDCDHEFEIQQSFSEDALTECSSCGGSLKKVYGNVGISFKGSGFYKNDARKGGGASGSGSGSSGSSTSTSGSESSTSSSNGSSSKDSSDTSSSSSSSKSSSSSTSTATSGSKSTSSAD